MLDKVHDIQTAYRHVIDVMSRPGTIADLSEEAGKLNQTLECLAATSILAHMLLDTEVTFKVVSERESKMAHLLSQLTYAKEAELEKADFIFILLDAAPGSLLQALEAAKIGDLQDPHRSATIIIETTSLLAQEIKVRMTGPGIQAETKIEIAMNEDWLDIRTQRNSEYPLGIDLIFVDDSHHIWALPRTTQIVKEEF
ncbi:phosphonate C-P lyase system protein PhnH [Paenibacillus sp. 2RAB27]|uniref:phosphonate C-P lyase system protein PhnH n=1 Tax=Paenibacillus sp. 2RAB27 TaxID=3232991 RepID=UPI003F962D46